MEEDLNYAQTANRERAWIKICKLISASNEGERIKSVYETPIVNGILPDEAISSFIYWCIRFNKHEILDSFFRTFELPGKLNLFGEDALPMDRSAAKETIAHKLEANDCPVQTLILRTTTAQSPLFNALKKNCSVKTLMLVKTGEFDASLQEYFNGPTLLKNLHVSNCLNNPGSDITPLLVAFLKNNKRVGTLMVSGCDLTLPNSSSSATDLMNAVGSHVNLRVFVLIRMKLSADLIDIFAQACAKNHQLEELHLRMHRFSDETAALGRLLATNTTLKALTLESSSPVDEKRSALLYESLAKNKSLEEIHLHLGRS